LSTAVEILLVDDNPADTDLASDVLARSGRDSHVTAVSDGVEAIAFLRREGRYAEAPPPHLVVLDLNLPRKDGRAVLAEVKADLVLRTTPIVVFSTSQAGHDIVGSYALGANSYVHKPGNLHEFVSSVKSIEEFWFGCARLPREEER
jgi:chemotaxis family two-component system response regulator Rcp1